MGPRICDLIKRPLPKGPATKKYQTTSPAVYQMELADSILQKSRIYALFNLMRRDLTTQKVEVLFFGCSPPKSSMIIPYAVLRLKARRENFNRKMLGTLKQQDTSMIPSKIIWNHKMVHSRVHMEEYQKRGLYIYIHILVSWSHALPQIAS